MKKNIFNPNDLKKLWRAKDNSHKGENGKVLVIGGSRLFHASIFWSANVASKLVDMVYFCSPANENNELVRSKIKNGFWNGIVVDWNDIDAYIAEAEGILIGPGMSRVKEWEEEIDDLTDAARMDRTDVIVNKLLTDYPNKRWIIDGGALQEVSGELLNKHHIITPHFREFLGLMHRSGDEWLISKTKLLNKGADVNQQRSVLEEIVKYFSTTHDEVTVLLKGVEDIVCRGENCEWVVGGNAGMTKGGTGDVLAGLVAALYTKNSAYLAAGAASYMNKVAGDRLYEQAGEFYNASDLVDEVGKLWGEMVK